MLSASRTLVCLKRQTLGFVKLAKYVDQFPAVASAMRALPTLFEGKADMKIAAFLPRFENQK